MMNILTTYFEIMQMVNPDNQLGFAPIIEEYANQYLPSGLKSVDSASYADLMVWLDQVNYLHEKRQTHHEVLSNRLVARAEERIRYLEQGEDKSVLTLIKSSDDRAFKTPAEAVLAYYLYQDLLYANASSLVGFTLAAMKSRTLKNIDELRSSGIPEDTLYPVGYALHFDSHALVSEQGCPKDIGTLFSIWLNTEVDDALKLEAYSFLIEDTLA